MSVEQAVDLLSRWVLMNPKRLVAYAAARLTGSDAFEAVCAGTYGKNWRESGGWNVPVAERYSRDDVATLDEIWARVVAPRLPEAGT